MKELFDKIGKWIQGEDMEKSKKDLRREEEEERMKDSRRIPSKTFIRPPPQHSTYDRGSFQQPRAHPLAPERRFPPSTFHINTHSKREIPHNRPMQERDPHRHLADAQYTPLTVSISHILHAVHDPKILPTPHPMAAPSDKRGSTNYCNYHKDVGHLTDECYSLKKNIELAIQNGYLQEYVDKRHNATDNRQPPNGPYPPKIINMVTTLPREKRQRTHGDVPLVISLHIGTCTVRCTLVDIGISVNIIYQNVLDAMSLQSPQQHNQPLPLVGFIGNVLYSKGSIMLHTTWGDDANQITKPMKF